MRERGDSRLAATHLIQLLGDQLDFSDGDRSFSPFYSDIGLGVTEAGGIAALFLHYNRRMTTFLEPFLALPDPVEPHRKTALGIQQRFREGEAEIAFCDHNTFIVDCSGLSTLQFNPALQEDFAERRCRRVAAGIVLFDGYLPTADPRDADRTFPFVVGLRLVTGSIESATADAVEMVAAAGQRLVLLFSVRVLEVDHGQVLSRLENGSSSAQEAQERGQGWWAEVIGPYEFGSVGDGEAEALR